MNSTASTTNFDLSPISIPADLKQNLQQFFNGQPAEEVQHELAQLKETLITESYGELDRGDKWFMIDFIKRIETLIGTAYAISLK
ncbi:hypothetical protein HHL16_16285 [Pseudoflavitalea sp. G-6-1-2]|uniref:hypothetical protein n=1 Tax=Pseudoflavitalea sp. G-6-1-2 TaxID=2728841 RepID=UPI00146D13FA|nr:hypothetical protein [Pseudoflavitalea sp. G-6-1-2]NML22444.1 hypothetical protein [Pseudoflavitalea sp. G-6-1-2]